MPAGEASKNFAQLEAVLGAVLEKRLERGSTLLALGGGVVGDLTGLAASLLLRGVDFIQVPTTLLAQVDSSVGGKTGINTRARQEPGRHVPSAAAGAGRPRFARHLPRRELLAGYAEVVKYGLIDEPEFFAWLEAQRRRSSSTATSRAGAMRSRRAARPRRASSAPTSARPAQRALLNLGHTFGHALEAALRLSAPSCCMARRSPSAW